MLFKVWDGLAVRPSYLTTISLSKQKCVSITLQDSTEYSVECESKEAAIKMIDDILQRLKGF